MKSCFLNYWCGYWSVVSLLNCCVVIELTKTKKEQRKRFTHAKRASLTRPTGMWGERKKTDCPFSIQWVRCDQGLKNVVELSKIYSQLRPLYKFDTPGDWFRERIARVTFVCTWLRTFLKIKNEWKWQYAYKSLFLLLEEAENRAESFR